MLPIFIPLFALWLGFFEGLLAVFSVILGPLFVVQAAFLLAWNGVWGLNGENPQQTSFNRVITVMEGLFESLPQLVLQVVVYLTWDQHGSCTEGESVKDDGIFFLISMGVSALCIIKSVIVFAMNYREIIALLAPKMEAPPEEDLEPVVGPQAKVKPRMDISSA